MRWALLVLAGLFEVCWAVGLKYTDGFKSLDPLRFVVVTPGLKHVVVSGGGRSQPVGTAYAVWVGIGAVVAVPGPSDASAS